MKHVRSLWTKYRYLECYSRWCV